MPTLCWMAPGCRTRVERGEPTCRSARPGRVRYQPARRLLELPRPLPERLARSSTSETSRRAEAGPPATITFASSIEGPLSSRVPARPSPPRGNAPATALRRLDRSGRGLPTDRTRRAEEADPRGRLPADVDDDRIPERGLLADEVAVAAAMSVNCRLDPPRAELRVPTRCPKRDRLPKSTVPIPVSPRAARSHPARLRQRGLELRVVGDIDSRRPVRGRLVGGPSRPEPRSRRRHRRRPERHFERTRGSPSELAA